LHKKYINFFFHNAENHNHNNDNTSPSLTPPPSASSKSPQPHPAFIQKENIESDDEHEIIEEDDEDSTEGRNTENASPNSLQNKRKKKTRTVFSRAQVFQLESTFDLKR
jgi:homeobox protein Nkx-5